MRLIKETYLYTHTLTQMASWSSRRCDLWNFIGLLQEKHQAPNLCQSPRLPAGPKKMPPVIAMASAFTCRSANATSCNEWDLAKLEYFTNLDFAEIRGSPFQNATFWGEGPVWGRELIWPNGMRFNILRFTHCDSTGLMAGIVSPYSLVHVTWQIARIYRTYWHKKWCRKCMCSFCWFCPSKWLWIQCFPCFFEVFGSNVFTCFPGC